MDPRPEGEHSSPRGRETRKERIGALPCPAFSDRPYPFFSSAIYGILCATISSICDVSSVGLACLLAHLSWRSDDDVVGDLAAPGDLLAPDGVPDGDLRRELGHLGRHLASLQRQLVRRGQTQHLKRQQILQ